MSRRETYLELHIGFREEGLEVGVAVLVDQHFTCGLVLIDREVGSVLFEDLDGALGLERLKLAGDFAGSSAKDLELSAFEKIVEVGQLTDEFLEEDAALLDKVLVLVARHLHVLHVDAAHGVFLGDGGDVAARPALV